MCGVSVVCEYGMSVVTVVRVSCEWCVNVVFVWSECCVVCGVLCVV